MLVMKLMKTNRITKLPLKYMVTLRSRSYTGQKTNIRSMCIAALIQSYLADLLRSFTKFVMHRRYVANWKSTHMAG